LTDNNMTTFKPYPFLLGFIVLFCFVRPTLAFGAGNIAGVSSVEGQNCGISPLQTWLASC
jgi:hypothetical protein